MIREKNDILVTISGILTTMLEDMGIEEEIETGSKLVEDLGFSSVDSLHIMASIDMELGKKLPYEKLVLRGGQYVSDLTVQELADFVYDTQDREDPEPMKMS
ncbi:MAG: acyl carrier protein [Verrucomicrobiota bacterium]